MQRVLPGYKHWSTTLGVQQSAGSDIYTIWQSVLDTGKSVSATGGPIIGEGELLLITGKPVLLPDRRVLVVDEQTGVTENPEIRYVC